MNNNVERYIVLDRAGFFHASYNTALERAQEFAVYTANFICGLVFSQTFDGDIQEVYDSEKKDKK